MEAFEKEQTEKERFIDSAYDAAHTLVGRGKEWLISYIGFLALIIGLVIIIFIAGIEETTMVKASNSTSGKLLNIWREQVGDEEGVLYPQEKTDIIKYKDREYYFVIEETDEEGNILKWYWAYDSGIDYVFRETRYYVLIAVTFVLTIMVAVISYLSTKSKEKKRKDFVLSLGYYKRNKEKIAPYTQYLPDFCEYKKKQAYELKKRDIVLSADLDYNYYNSEKFNPEKLEKWQKRRLKKIRKIRVEEMSPSDLLQEYKKTGLKVEMLPMSEEKHFKRFVIKNIFSRLFSIGTTGVVIGFGFKFGNIQLALLLGSMVAGGWAGAVVSAIVYVSETLRYRFISKGDYLNEFYNIKEQFIISPSKTDESDYYTQKKDNLLTQAIEEGKNGGFVFQSD